MAQLLPVEEFDLVIFGGTGDLSRFHPHTLAALESYSKALGRLERVTSHLRTDELRLAFLEDKLEVYESLIALARIDGLAAIPRIVPFLGHDSAHLREAAVTALAETGDPSAESGARRSISVASLSCRRSRSISSRNPGSSPQASSRNVAFIFAL